MLNVALLWDEIKLNSKQDGHNNWRKSHLLFCCIDISQWLFLNIFFLFLLVFMYLRLQDFMSCLRRRSLLSRLSPNRRLTLLAAKTRNYPQVSVRVHPALIAPHYTITHHLFKCLYYILPGHNQPGSAHGSPCSIDQVPSPGSSSSPLIKNEQNQVCVCIILM